MKHRLAMIAVSASLLSLPLAAFLLWRQGIPIVWPVFFIVHLLLNKLIRMVGQTRRELAFLGAAHLVVTVAAHLLFDRMWNVFVYGGHPDNETIGAYLLGILAGIAIVSYQLYVNLREKAG